MADTVNCMHYKSEKELLENREIRSTRSQLEPLEFLIVWCAHENSPHRRDSMGRLECKGDVSKCTLVIKR